MRRVPGPRGGRARSHSATGRATSGWLAVVTVAGAADSRLTLGIHRSSQVGNHQLASPSSSIVAGTSTMRTMVASMKTAMARPSPKVLMIGSSPSTKDRKIVTMMAAAAVITRAVAARPSATAVALSPERSYSSRTRDSRNTS